MSQPDAALYIQPPTFETRVAVHMTAKALWRNGAANDTALTAVAPVLVSSLSPAIRHQSIFIFIDAAEKKQCFSQMELREGTIPNPITGHHHQPETMQNSGG